MNAAETIRKAEASGIRLGVEGTDLVLDADLKPPVEVVNAVRRHKAEIIELLVAPEDRWTAQDWRVFYDERAGIAEFDGGLPREWAEGLARLLAMPCPPQVLPQRWSRFIDDAARFADRWAAQAAALGWGPEDIWGCDGSKPVERLDHAGLCWLLDGKEPVALTTQTATIRTKTGITQTFVRRRSTESCEVLLAWELRG